MYDLQHIVYATLRQIESAIQQIQIWNVNIGCADDYLTSNDGMKTLAATSMMIEAIGEGVKKIDNKTDGKFLINKPEIPWQEIKKYAIFWPMDILMWMQIKFMILFQQNWSH